MLWIVVGESHKSCHTTNDWNSYEWMNGSKSCMPRQRSSFRYWFENDWGTSDGLRLRGFKSIRIIIIIIIGRASLASHLNNRTRHLLHVWRATQQQLSICIASSLIQRDEMMFGVVFCFLFFTAMLVMMVPLVNGYYEEPPYFQFYEHQLGSDFLKRCQKSPEPPNTGDAGCRNVPKACMWGIQVCVGSNDAGGIMQPKTRCTCYHQNWTCQSFKCPNIDAQCPSIDPTIVTPAPVCSADLNCGYEDQFCCGKRFAKKL